MKKIYYLIAGTVLLCLVSCLEIDNWKAPEAGITGKIIDSYTGKNLVMDHNDWQIRIWERSWIDGANVNPQNLAVKNDGTYNNDKLFAGTYDMLPYDGPFWQTTDTLKGVVLKNKKHTVQDFTVTPYLQILDFETNLTTMQFSGTEWPALTMKCRVRAPLLELEGTKLPNFYRIQPFISLLENFCGNSNKIDVNEYNNAVRIDIDRTWDAEMAQKFQLPAGTLTSGVYEIKPMPLKRGYTYYVRIGASVKTLSNRFHYSPVVKIVVPN